MVKYLVYEADFEVYLCDNDDEIYIDTCPDSLDLESCVILTLDSVKKLHIALGKWLEERDDA